MSEWWHKLQSHFSFRILVERLGSISMGRPVSKRKRVPSTPTAKIVDRRVTGKSSPSPTSESSQGASTSSSSSSSASQSNSTKRGVDHRILESEAASCPVAEARQYKTPMGKRFHNAWRSWCKRQERRSTVDMKKLFDKGKNLLALTARRRCEFGKMFCDDESVKLPIRLFCRDTYMPKWEEKLRLVNKRKRKTECVDGSVVLLTFNGPGGMLPVQGGIGQQSDAEPCAALRTDSEVEAIRKEVDEFRIRLARKYRVEIREIRLTCVGCRS